MRLKLLLAMLFVSIMLAPGTLVFTQEAEEEDLIIEEAVSEEIAEEMTEEPLEAEVETSTLVEKPSGNVTLDFKDADIRNVLRILSYKGGINIVAGRGVEGPVTIRLTDVPWEKALDVILKTYDYGYERDGNIITVCPIEALTKKKLAEKELAEVEPLITEVFTLRFLDANDAKKVLEAQLSSRGKLTVLEIRSVKGWEFTVTSGGEGGEGGGLVKRERTEGETRSKVLVISDIHSYMEKIKKIIAKIDVMPKQIMIEARIMEVNRDVLEDIGFDWATGSAGAESSTVATQSVGMTRIGGQSLGSQVAPNIFDPKAGTTLTGYEPFNTGMQFVFQKLTGTQFEVIIHALEEDVDTNTLSSPRIMTLENQEATILVGTKYPIIKQEAQLPTTGATTTTVTGGSLDYYENVGIQLNVVPQTSGDDFINMIVHPAVSSRTGWESIDTGAGSSTRYPIIDIREVETQVLMKDGETVVIGGLLKDVKSKGKFSVPILGDIPIIGLLFQRNTEDTQKIDLLIFITARVVKPEMGKEYIYGSQSRIPTMKEIEKREPGYGRGLEPFRQEAIDRPKQTDIKRPGKE